MDKRIVELALEALEQKKLAIEAEMQLLQSELRGREQAKGRGPWRRT